MNLGKVIQPSPDKLPRKNWPTFPCPTAVSFWRFLKRNRKTKTLICHHGRWTEIGCGPEAKAESAKALQVSQHVLLNKTTVLKLKKLDLCTRPGKTNSHLGSRYAELLPPNPALSDSNHFDKWPDI